jgi:hypothetical protein
MVDDDRVSRESMEQFYELLAKYGLTGKSQPLTRRQQQDSHEVFTDDKD